MSINRAMDISASGINANRMHLEIISSNLANINSTRSVSGGPYARRVPIFSENPLTFEDTLRHAEQNIGGGVALVGIEEDNTPSQKVYNPSHPDADAQGFVAYPNVDMSQEMVDMVYASKLYEANITAFNAAKKMATDTLQIQ